MSIKYVAFDVETPNHCNNKICSIGITVIEDNCILSSEEFLVNPECDFDQINTGIHGICHAMVKNSPVFPEIWNKIAPLFSDCLVVAHNAHFDLCVLKKTLSAYGINAPCIRYIDTMKIAQYLIHDVENYKLQTLCDYFGIYNINHNAGSDSEACARILCSLISLGAYIPDFVNSYDLADTECHTETSHHSHALSDNSRALSELNTILKVISCDGVLAKEEIDFLIKWMNDNTKLHGNYPYDRIYDRLTIVLADGIIDSTESQELLELFQNIDNPVEHTDSSCSCSDLCDKKICLTGDFNFGTKDDVACRLTALGAIVQKSVTLKTDILIVGTNGSEAWSMGNYGNKVKKALELQEKGHDILIIKECDFFAKLGDK